MWVNECRPRCASGRKLQCKEGKYFSIQLLPLSLSVATGSLPGDCDWLITSLSMSVCVCLSVRSCIPTCMCAHPCFCRFYFLPVSPMTDWQHLRVCWCVSAYLSVCWRSVPLCVLPLAHLTPHLLVSSQQAFHWAVTQCATVLSLKRAGLRG